MRNRVMVILGMTLTAPAMAQDGVTLGVLVQKQSLSVTEQGRGALAARQADDRLTTDAALGLGLAFGSAQGDARLLLELGGVGVEDAFEVDMYTLGLEKFFPVGDSSALRPFIGINAGYGKLDVDAGYATGTRAADDNAFIYGASAGVQYMLTPTLALEARYRYLHTGLETELQTAAPATSLTFAVDDASAVSAGVSFQF